MNFSNDSFLSFKFEYNKQLYDAEIQRRQYANNKVNMTVTIIITLLSAYVWVILHYFGKFQNNVLANKINIFILSFIIITGLSIVLTIVFFICSLMSYEESLNDPCKIDMLIEQSEMLLPSCNQTELIDNILTQLSQAYMTAAKDNYKKRVGRSIS